MTTKSISLGLISRPMHLLAVREFIALHPDEFFIVLVSYSADKNEREAIRQQLHIFKTDNIRVIEKLPPFGAEGLNICLFLLQAVLMRLRLGKLSHVLLSGGVKSRILYKHLDFHKLILIDEGASSLWKIPHTIETGIPFRQATGFRRLYRLFRVNDLPIKPFSVFTMYERFWKTSEIIVPNELTFWKKLLATYSIKENEVLILGTTYTKFGLEKPAYEKLLMNRIAQFTGRDIFYKYHKKEKDSITLPGVKILQTKLPIESYFISNKYFPGTMIAINSTSLRIIQLIKPDVDIINIDLKFK